MGQKPFILQILLLGSLSLSGVSCYPELSQKSVPSSASPVSSSKTDSAAESTRIQAQREKVHIELGAVKIDQKEGNSLALVSVIDEIEYKIQGCASGHTEQFMASAASSIKLYKYDQGCQVLIQSLSIQGQKYFLPIGQSFNPSVQAVSNFESGTGLKLYAKVHSQLPSILTDSFYSVSFTLSELIVGSDQLIPIYEIGMSSSLSSLTEGQGTSAQLIIKRAIPAIGALTINLQWSGSATPGVDVSALPSTLSFADGESQLILPIQCLDDSQPEVTETLTASLATGNYFIKGGAVSLSILDNDFGQLSASASPLQFGSRALNLPHAMSLTLSNIGQGPISSLQLGQNLAAPFFFPSGSFPGEGGTCGSDLAAGQSCTLRIGFNPSAVAAFNQSMQLQYFDRLTTQTLTISLQGSGAAAAYLKHQFADSIAFPLTLPNQTVKRHISLSNIGNASLSSLQVQVLPGTFQFLGGTYPGTGGSCGTSLAANSSCSIVISFSPVAIGYYQGSLNFTYNNGFQSLSFSSLLEGSSHSVLAQSEVYTTASDTPRSINLLALGNATSYTIVRAPHFGNLSGTAPTLSYQPMAGFSGIDSFIFRVNDSSGPSPDAEVRIMVSPKAVLLVANPASLNTMDLRIKSQLEARGFIVSLVDDAVSNASDAIGKDLIAVSSSVTPASILAKYKDVALPVIIWDRGLYDDMKMISSSSATGRTGTISQITILENSSYMNRGYAIGNLTVLTSNTRLSFVTNNDANVLRFSRDPSNSSNFLEWAYETDAYMPGLMIAPGRRLGTFYPQTNGDFTSAGLNRILRNIDWAMQSQGAIFQDTFKRDPSTSLGYGWTEWETSASELTVNGQALQFQVGNSTAVARHPISLQSSGVISMEFYLDLVRTSSLPADTSLQIQLGRCDLMDQQITNDTGIGVHLLWGGTQAGLSTENALGYKTNTSSIQTLGVLNSPSQPLSLRIDLTSRTYQIKSPLGTSPSIGFQNNVSLDCIRILSKNINSSEFSSRSLHHFRIYRDQ